MRMFFMLYKKSALATITSLIGSVCATYGVAGIVSSIIDKDFYYGAVIMFIVGVGLLVGAHYINKAVIKHKIEKSLNDKKMNDYVGRSALAAYSLYKNAPSQEMLRHINIYNPKAANLIFLCTTKQILPEEMLTCLIRLDIENSTIDIWENEDSYLYKNRMFKLEPVVEKSLVDIVKNQRNQHIT